MLAFLIKPAEVRFPFQLFSGLFSPSTSVASACLPLFSTFWCPKSNVIFFYPCFRTRVFAISGAKLISPFSGHGPLDQMQGFSAGLRRPGPLAGSLFEHGFDKNPKTENFRQLGVIRLAISRPKLFLRVTLFRRFFGHFWSSNAKTLTFL